MNWTDWMYLLVGIGVGVTIERWGRSTDSAGGGPVVMPAIAPVVEQPGRSELAEKLSQMEWAYHRSTEMSQFKGGFLARTAHELRSPLNGLIGMQQLILSDLCDSPAEEREFIAQSNESALKMVAVLDNVIEVSKLEQGRSQLEVQPVQLSQVLQDVYTLTHLQAKNRNLRLQIDYPDPEWYVLADPFALRQVLVNLIDRALQQMLSGTIAVSAQWVQGAEPTAQIWIDNSEPNCWSEPIDFLQTPAPFPSTGLTFWIDQALLQQMRGDLALVTVESPSPSSSMEPIATRLQCTLPLVSLEDLGS
jgi:signal transduction histidine kinase